MKLDEKNFFLDIDNFFLCEKKPSIAVAVSGGPDSLALIYLMQKWIVYKKGKILGLIIDHRLRLESYIECKTTQKYLKNLNIDSKIIRISDKSLNKKNMHEARYNRYEKLIDYCLKNNILHLFLGHHFDDNLETFLIRKIAGSNIEGLKCMSFSSFRNGIQLIRPLLNYNKKQIINYNNLNSINYIKDPSNENEKFTRVQIRNYLKNTNKLQLIKKDFKQIKHYTPSYKLMINKILQFIIIKLKKNLIVISFKDFKILDENIKVAIIEKIYSFFYKKNKRLRLSKIIDFLSKRNVSNLKSYNLGSMIIIKNKNFLEFSLIN